MQEKQPPLPSISSALCTLNQPKIRYKNHKSLGKQSFDYIHLFGLVYCLTPVLNTSHGLIRQLRIFQVLKLIL